MRIVFVECRVSSSIDVLAIFILLNSIEDCSNIVDDRVWWFAWASIYKLPPLCICTNYLWWVGGHFLRCMCGIINKWFIINSVVKIVVFRPHDALIMEKLKFHGYIFMRRPMKGNPFMSQEIWDIIWSFQGYHMLQQVVSRKVNPNWSVAAIVA